MDGASGNDRRRPHIMGAIMTIRFSASVLAVAILVAVASLPLPALASEGLAQPVVSKRAGAASTLIVRFTRTSVWRKPARVASNWSHNPNVMLGVAY
jgi:hypothetical protein